MPRHLQIGLPGLHADISLTRLSEQERRRLYRENNVYFEGTYTDWDVAAATATSYSMPVILERAIAATRRVVSGEVAFERDTVCFDVPQVPHIPFCWLLYVATLEQGRLNVLDFGGALGTSYYQMRAFLTHLEHLTWSVVEQEGFVQAGQAEFATSQLHFYDTVAECVEEQRSNFLLLSGCLQYLERPYETLRDILSRDIPFVLIDRTTARRGLGDMLSVQFVPESIYKASYPVWMLDSERIEATVRAAGYEIVDHFDPHPGSTFGLEGQQFPYAGWFIKRLGSLV